MIGHELLKKTEKGRSFILSFCLFLRFMLTIVYFVSIQTAILLSSFQSFPADE